MRSCKQLFIFGHVVTLSLHASLRRGIYKCIVGSKVDAIAHCSLLVHQICAVRVNIELAMITL